MNDSPDNETRFSNMRARYHVGSETVGLIETYRGKLDAFDAAIRHANKNGETVTVFDSLARYGAPQLWTFPPGLYLPEDNIVNAGIAPTRRKAVEGK